MKSNLYKHPTFGHVYGEELLTPEVRCAWVSIVTPKDPPPPKEGMPPGQPRYEVTLLFPQNEGSKTFFSKLKGMVDEMLALYNEGKKAKLSEVSLYQEGSKLDLEKYPYYENHFIIQARNAKKPIVVNQKRESITGAEIVGGMFVQALIVPLVTAHGVSYKLNALQLRRDDGTRFGGGKKDLTSIFSIVDEEESEAPAATTKKSGKSAAVDIL